MRFSQRIGKMPLKVDVQKESMDEDLRIGLWNAFQIFYLDEVGTRWIQNSNFNYFFKVIWLNFFKLPLDNMDDSFESTYSRIRKWFFKAEWYEIYDFIEFVPTVESPANKKGFKTFCNDMLEKELSAYRFIDDYITEIIDGTELKEIEEAIEESDKSKFVGVNKHLKTALAMLSDRKNPDYRNSIKESISAIEAMCQIITGDYKAELGKALKVLERSIDIHPALKRGFSALYGYTSDEGGIRHAMIDENNSQFEDAKYMLVSASAFINYLKVKYSKSKV